jgi:hypothetical protein
VRQKVSEQALAQGFDGWDTKKCSMYDPSGSSPGRGNDCSAAFEAFRVDRCHGKDNHIFESSEIYQSLLLYRFVCVTLRSQPTNTHRRAESDDFPKMQTLYLHCNFSESLHSEM